MFNKKLSLLALSVMALAACGGGGSSSASSQAVADNSDLKLWCPAGDTDMMNKIIAAYKEANPSYTGTIEIDANKGEGEIATELTKDLSAAADVFCIADDNIRTSVRAYALVPLTEAEKAAEETANGKSAVEAGSVSGTMYGYAYRADNSYPLFYDGGFFAADDVKTLEGLLAKAKASSKKVYIPWDNAWYAPSFLWSTGGTLSLDDAGKQLCDFNTKSVKAAEAVMALYQQYGGETMIWADTAAEIEAGFKDGSVVAAVLWNDYDTIKSGMPAERQGDLKITKLPTLKVENADKQLGAFVGYKYTAVKAGLAEGKKARAQDFAKFVANKDNQKKRALELGYGPSNLELAADSEIKALPFVAAVAEQVATGMTFAQGTSVNGDFWTPMASFTSLIKNSKDGSWGTYDSAKDALDAMVEAFQG